MALIGGRKNAHVLPWKVTDSKFADPQSIRQHYQGDISWKVKKIIFMKMPFGILSIHLFPCAFAKSSWWNPEFQRMWGDSTQKSIAVLRSPMLVQR